MIQNYENLNIKSIELCTTIENFNKNNPGNVKCHIPSLMPCIPQGKPIDNTVRINNKHYENITKPNINTSIIEANYIEIPIPSMYTSDISTGIYDNGIVKRPITFIIAFVGGDINNIKVIGRES